MARIFVSWPDYSPNDPETGARLTAAGHELLIFPKVGARSEKELLSLIRGCVAAIVSTDPFTATVITSTPSLRFIARVGVGTDSIDLAAANAHGVGVSVTPGLNAEPVADHTLALMLALIRRVVPQDLGVKSGRWDRVGPNTPSELPAKTVGLIGAGTIGRAVMRRLSGFDVKLIFLDAFVSGVEQATKIESLEELLTLSDIVSLHCPLTGETRGLLNAKTLRLMKSTAFLINTARGPLVDQEALFAALRKGSIAGAGLDVFAEEPPDPVALSDVPNLITSAHIGGLSRESIRRMTISATDSVLVLLEGRIPATLINRHALNRWHMNAEPPL
jgi:phosphoglycerate dehydrogenase-like enzyme